MYKILLVGLGGFSGAICRYLIQTMFSNRYPGTFPWGTFAVNILGQEHVELSNRFAWVKDEDRFAVGAWTGAVTGAPVLADALTWLDCTVHDRIVAGSHTVYIGLVEATAEQSGERPPLVYWNRGYRHLQLQEESE